MRRTSVLAGVSICLALSAPLRLSGQSTDPLYDAQGFQQGRDYFSELPFEHIDTMTGNVLLTFTDLALPGNAGLDVEIVRAYNSKTPAGWTFGLGGYPYRIDNPDGVPGSVNPFTTDPRPYFPRLRMPDGSRPELFSESQYSFPIFRTNQFWRYHVSGRRLQLPDGTEAFYTAGGLLSYVQDPFGNRINLTYTGGSLQQISQVLGSQVRTIVFSGDVPAGAVPGSMTYLGRTWNYYFNAGGLYQVTPPTGPSWQFNYNVNLPGVIDTVFTPHGGLVQYGFAVRSFTNGGPSPVSSRVLLSRYTAGTNVSSPGSWIFDYSYRLGESNTVTGPNNTLSVYEYATPAGATEPSLQTVTRNDYNVQTERDTRSYQVRPVTDWGGGPTTLLASRAITRNGQTFTTTLSYATGNFADFGRPTTVQETGTFQRTTTYAFDYDFDPSRWIKDKIASKTVTMNGEPFVVTRSHNYTTGFMDSQTRYGVTTTYGADPNGSGNIERTTDAHGHVTSFTYDWGVVKNTNTPLYTISRLINSDGTVGSETRDGKTTTFSYDALGRQTWVVPPLGYGIQTEYMTSEIRKTRSDGASAGGRTTRTITRLDGFGRVIGTQDTQGVKTTIRYDALGHKVFESLPFEGSAEVGTTYTYDGLGRMLTLQKSGGPTTTFTFGTGTVIISEPNFLETRVTTQTWGAFGDPADRLLVGVMDAENSAWAYEYNALGRLTKVTQPAGSPRVWTYYQGTDRLKSESHPENGLTSYRYDDAGLLFIKDTPRDEFIYGYDANDRVTSITSGYPSHSVTINYDNKDDRISLLVNGYVTSTFHYDDAGRTEWRRDTITGAAGDGPRQTTYTYNGWDDVVGIQYPSGRTVTYEYDSESRPRKVLRDGGQLVAEALTYHPAGGIKTLSLDNGITESFEYEPNRYWLASVAGGPVDLTYQYDQVGNVRVLTDHVSPSLNQSFTYDRIDRVKIIGGFGGTGFQYDPLGNRISKDAGGLTYTYDYWNRLSNVAGSLPNPEVGNYTFDTAGGMRSDPSGTYTYTPFDMLETATVGGATTVYRYDGDNLRRVRIRPSGFDFFYHGTGESLLSEFRHTGEPPGQWVRDYIYLGSRLVASVRATVNNGVAVGIVPPLSVMLPETNGTTTATIRLSIPQAVPQLEAPLSVQYSTANQSAVAGLDYAPVQGTITFPQGAVDGATQTVSLAVLDDALNENAESFVFKLSNVIDGSLGANDTLTVYIDDNDPMPVLSINSTPSSEGSQAQLVLALSALSGRTVSALVQTSDISTALADYTPINTTIEIPPGTVGLTLNTSIARDGLVEPDEVFRATVSSPSGATLGAAITDVPIIDERNGDFNGDGLPDLLWQRTTDDQIGLWLTNQAFGFAVQQLIAGIDPPWKIVGSGDFNGDRKMDFVWRHDQDGLMAVWFMDMRTVLGTAMIQDTVPDNATTPDPWRVVAVADFTRDGQPDIVLQNSDNGTVKIWRMQGTTNVGTSWVWTEPFDPVWKIVGSGRFDPNDATTQLLFQNHTTGQIVLWHLNPDLTRLRADSLPDALTSDPSYWIVATADFNRDGVTDLVWKHQTQSLCLAFWLMDPVIHTVGGVPDGLAHKMSGQCVADPPTDLTWKIVAPK